MSRLDDDARLAAALVREAGQLARRMRTGGIDAEEKTSVSDLVTAADRAAERLVVQRLRAERPEDAIVGEEGTDHAGTSGRTWVIDPVDGTYNFVAGLDWWCSALALTDGDDLVLGAVAHPHDDEVYLGGPALPTTGNGVALAPIEDRPLAAVCAATYLHYPRATPEIAACVARVASGAATVRMLGSGSMDATAVARGHLGVVFQHSVPDWDRLPGAALIRGAGGVARQVEAGGTTWAVAGGRSAVDDVCRALTGP